MESSGWLYFICSFNHSDDFKCFRVAHTNFYYNLHVCMAYTFTVIAIHVHVPLLSSTTPTSFKSSTLSKPHETSFASHPLFNGRELTARSIPHRSDGHAPEKQAKRLVQNFTRAFLISAQHCEREVRGRHVFLNTAHR